MGGRIHKKTKTVCGLKEVVFAKSKSKRPPQSSHPSPQKSVDRNESNNGKIFTYTYIHIATHTIYHLVVTVMCILLYIIAVRTKKWRGEAMRCRSVCVSMCIHPTHTHTHIHTHIHPPTHTHTHKHSLSISSLSSPFLSSPIFTPKDCPPKPSYRCPYFLHLRSLRIHHPCPQGSNKDGVQVVTWREAFVFHGGIRTGGRDWVCGHL